MFKIVHGRKEKYTNMKLTYIKTQLKTLINVSKIVTIHYYELDENFVFSGEAHNFWEMVYIDKGQVIVKRDEEEILLTQGDVIFHRPNEFHAIRAYESHPNFFVMSFSCTSAPIHCLEKYYTKLDKMLKPYISEIIKEAESTFIIPKNDTNLKKLVLKQDAIIGGEQLIKNYLEQLLVLLVRKVTAIGKISVFPNKDSMENNLISSIKDFLEKSAEQKIRIADVCKKFGYSKSYLSKIFHEQTGVTIANYSNYVKIKQAKQLIREDNLNLSEISDKLAFDNPQYFSRVFKRMTGMTPTEFKSTLNLNT